MRTLTKAQMKDFQNTVLDYYQTFGRHDLPWRLSEAGGQFNPYKILVSELMLQQTQVNRVIPKYLEFIERFPTITGLAEASLADVLRAWSGLGYNRRANYLQQAARQLTRENNGLFPTELPALECLPGVGRSTAGAVLVYAYNKPELFIETNIRTIFIYHFFPKQTKVSDTQLRSYLSQTIDTKHPRQFYWALMDYGSYLKKVIGNVSRNSQNYVRQSSFQGSRRQVRGQVIAALIPGALTRRELHHTIHDAQLATVLTDLEQEGFIQMERGVYQLHA